MAAKTKTKTTPTAKPVLLTELENTHEVLQRLREAARADGRRSDAQRYADTQFLIREEMKLAARRKSPATTS